MSIEASRKILKVWGIIAIVIAAIGMVISLVAIIGGGVMNETMGGVLIIPGIILMISFCILLLWGIFSVRAANDTSRIMPAFVLSTIALVVDAIGLIAVIISRGNIIPRIVSICISILVLIAANTIRKNG